MGPCDLKLSGKAWNDGVTAFHNAFMLSDNDDPTRAIKFAMEEVKAKNPHIDFSEESFYKPLIDHYKEQGLVDKNYQYKKSKLTGIEKALNNFKNLDADKKKKLADKIEKLDEVTPQKVKNAYAELTGKPSFTPELNSLIDRAAEDRKAYEDNESEIEKAFGEIQKHKADKTHTPEVEKEYSAKFDELNKKQNELLEKYLQSDMKLGEALSKGRHWFYQFGDLQKMNLMNPTTLLKNMTGMVADGVWRNVSKLISTPTGMMITAIRKGLGKTDASYSSVGTVASLNALGKGNARFKAKLYAKYGTEPVYSDQLRTPNWIDGTKNIADFIKGERTLPNVLGAIFKFHAAGITRGLGAPDFLFQETSKVAELNRIGLQKGYSGAELKGFIMNPDAKSKLQAEEYAKKITYKQDLKFLGGHLDLDQKSLDFAKIGDKVIEDGGNPFITRLWTGLLHMAKNKVVPFFKTPINLLRNANQLVLPEYALAKGLVEAQKEYKEGNTDEALQKINSSVIGSIAGFHFRSVILSMVAQGLMTAGYDDEEDKAREVIEKKTGGSSKYNVNALIRGLAYGEVKAKPGDLWVENSATGAIGIAMGAYAHAFSQYNKKDREKEADWYGNGFDDYVSTLQKTSMSEISGALDNSFFSGINELERAFKDKGGARANKYAQQTLMTVIGGLLPATHQQLSKAAVETRDKTYDKELTFSENIYNALGYNFGFGSFGRPTPNYNALRGQGEPVKKTKEKLLFDGYLGRYLASADPFKGKIAPDENTPVGRLYEAMREVEAKERGNLAPGMVDNEINVGTKKKTRYAPLDDQQFEYLQDRASLHRMLLATPFIMSQDFKEANHETRVKKLEMLYSEGRKEAIKELKQAFPEIKKKGKARNGGNISQKILNKKYR